MVKSLFDDIEMYLLIEHTIGDLAKELGEDALIEGDESLEEAVQRKEPDSDLGQRIQAEFELRKGEFADRERKLILDYLEKDYEASRVSANEYYALVKKSPDKEKYPLYLKKSLQLIQRAAFDAQLNKKLEPDDPAIDEKLSILQGAREHLHLAIEFPDHYEELWPLHKRMAEAISNGDYETAAKCQDEIKTITSMES